MPLLLIVFMWCSAGVQDSSGGLDMMKEHCSGHISLIWRSGKPQPSKIKKGMSAFALYLLQPAEFKFWHVLNSTTVFETIWGNTTVFLIFAVLWQSCAKILFFYYNLETLTLPKYLWFLKNVSALGEEWQSCVTISAQCQNNRFTGSRSSCRIVSFQAKILTELYNSISSTYICSDLQAVCQCVNAYLFISVCLYFWGFFFC